MWFHLVSLNIRNFKYQCLNPAFQILKKNFALSKWKYRNSNNQKNDQEINIDSNMIKNVDLFYISIMYNVYIKQSKVEKRIRSFLWKIHIFDLWIFINLLFIQEREICKNKIFWLRFIFVSQKSLNQRLNPVFEYNIIF